MKRRSCIVWVATMVCGMVFISLMSCQKKEETQRMEKTEQTEENEYDVKDKPILEEEMEQNSSLAKSREVTGSIPAKSTLRFSREPRLGETVDLIFTITPSEDVPVMNVVFRMLRGVELVGSEKVVKSSARKNETKEFVSKVKFIASPAWVSVIVGGTAVMADGKRFPLFEGKILRRIIIDEETKQFGSYGQKLEMGPEYRYDMAIGEIFPPGEYLGSGPYAREMIERLKKMEPQLTDWEAIYLHRDALRALWKGIGGSDDEKIRWFLKEGWLEKQRKGEAVKDKWLEELIQRNLEEQKKSQGEEGGLFVPEKESLSTIIQVETRFVGQFRYKKHKYGSCGIVEYPSSLY